MNKMKWFLAATAGVLMLQLPTGAQAFDCPNRFDAAQAVIDKVAGDMKSMKDQMPQEKHALVHALLDDAKQLLVAARHHHEKPQGAYDHGRSVAKAGSALAYAEAADLLQKKYMM